MEIKLLVNFLSIVDHKSLSKAAETLHIAQPALSLQLKKLEEELGVILIDRTTRYFQITEAGQLFAKRARQIVELSETAVVEVKELNHDGVGMVKIGTIGSEMEVMLPEMLTKFRKSYPKATFRCFEGSTVEVMTNLELGIIDVGIVRSPIDVTHFNYLSLEEKPMVAARKEGAFNKAILNWEDLKSEELIVLNRFHDIIVRECRRYDFTPKIVGSFEDTRSLMLMAGAGVGTAIVQEDWLKIAPMSLQFCPIECGELMTHTIVVWQKNRYMSKVAENFVAFICEQLNKE